MSPFFPQNGMVTETAYVQAENDEDSDDSVVLLGYNPENSSGKVMAISADSSSDDADDDDEGEDEDEIEQDDSNAKSVEDQNEEITDVKQIIKSMDKDYGQMRMIQVANNIAQDMGIVLKVSFN